MDPVVVGFARADLEERHTAGYPEQDTLKAFAILVHGDAAFPGQGIVAETLNLGGLKYIAPTLFELTSGNLTVGYIGRPDRSSPAGGDPNVLKNEQEQMLNMR